MAPPLRDAPDLPSAQGPGATGARDAPVVVCARTDNDSVWTGYLPPSQAVTDPRAVAMLVLDRRDAGTGCGDHPHHPTNSDHAPACSPPECVP